MSDIYTLIYDLYDIYQYCATMPPPYIYDTLSCIIRHNLCTILYLVPGRLTTRTANADFCGKLREVACGAVHC